LSSVNNSISVTVTCSEGCTVVVYSYVLYYQEGCVCLATSPELSHIRIHMSALHMAISCLPADWHRRRSWPGMAECAGPIEMRQLVEMAMLCQGRTTWWCWWRARRR